MKGSLQIAVYSLILILGLTLGYMFGYLQLQPKITELTSRLTELSQRLSAVEEVRANFTSTLEKVEKALNSTYRSLQLMYENYTRLRSDYEMLQEAYEELKESSNLNLKLLPDQKFYPEALRLIAKANRSVYIAVYVAKYDPDEPDDPANKLLEALVQAYRKGLDVKVIFDDETLRSYPETVAMLKNAGVPVKLDESESVRTHVKIVVVDRLYVLVGSHNWTESALSFNHEYSILMYSRYYADKVAGYIEGIWAEGREPQLS